MAILSDILGSHVDEKLYAEDSKLVSNSDAIGVEIELENIVYSWRDGGTETPDNARFSGSNAADLPKISRFWYVTPDNSLREGTEFIFREPFIGANITKALSTLQEFLDGYLRKRSPASISERCSVHIHSDARDMTDKQIINQVLVYILVERLLFQYINPVRSKNNYCRPLTDSSFKYIFKDLFYYSKSGNLSNVVSVIRNKCDKYSALNLLTLSRYGSFEYRHMSGKTNMSDVLDWINVILSIKKISRSTDIKDLLALANNDLVKIIFSGTVLESMDSIISKFELDEYLMLGRSNVNELLEMERIHKMQAKFMYPKDDNLGPLFTKFISSKPELSKKIQPKEPTKKVVEEAPVPPNTWIVPDDGVQIALNPEDFVQMFTPNPASIRLRGASTRREQSGIGIDRNPNEPLAPREPRPVSTTPRTIRPSVPRGFLVEEEPVASPFNLDLGEE